MERQGRLEGRVAFITGGARGIGLATARAFVAEGANVVLGDLSAEHLANAVAELGDSRAVGVTIDTARAEDADRLVSAALDRWGRLDIAFCGAGINLPVPAVDIKEEDWRRVVDVNLTGVFLTARAAGRVMLEQGSGVVLLVSSMYGKRAVPNRLPYVTTKYAVIGMCEALAVEWAPVVRVNALAPGYTETEAFRERQQQHGSNVEQLVARTPMGRLGRPDETAKAAMYLASDDASWVTGSTLVIDGGWTALGAELRADRPAYPRGARR
ncbi:MAG: SDR family oxidoreductase [Chloroflexi bacterium]|nr:SDR family oxidoreductase [Chloroflexota bacterium]